MGRTSDAKEKLLEATLELIWQQSFGAVSVDDICQKAGVKKGSFYYFFTSKESLVIAALDRHWANMRVNLDSIFSPTVPPAERLRRYFELVYNNQVKYKIKYGHVLGCVIRSVGTEVSTIEQVICNKVRSILDEKVRYIASAIRDLQHDGQIQVQDPFVMAKAIYNMFEGTLAQARIQNDPEVLKTLWPAVKEMLRLSDDAVAAEPGSAEKAAATS